MDRNPALDVSVPRRTIWLWTVAVVGFVATGLAAPVPAGNEPTYMPLLKTKGDPTYLFNDWTFGSGFSEHAVFNFVLSPLVDVIGMELLAWTGRLVTWLIIARLLMALGRRIGAPPWATFVSMVLFIGIDQSMGVGAEYLFSSFEAKSVAWPLLLGALIAAIDERTTLAALLAGLTFSFHPAVGIWAGGALLLALFVDRRTRAQMGKALPLTVFAGLAGLIPLLPGLLNSMSPEIVEFIVLNRIPQHVDPFSFGERGPFVLALMLVFNLWWAYRHRSRSVGRLLGVFQLALIGVMAAGVLARITEMYDLLLYQPFRVLPVVAPIIFFLTLSAILFDIARSRSRDTLRDGARLLSIGGLALLSLLVLWNPPARWLDDIEDNRAAWRQPVTEVRMAFDWISLNTPVDSVVASPPWEDQMFYRSERAQLVSWGAVTYDRPQEWLARLRAVLGDLDVLYARSMDDTDRLDRYQMVSADTWSEIADLYNVTHVLTPADYVAAPLYSAGEWNVYDLDSLRGY